MFLRRVGTGVALLIAGAFYGAGAQAAPVGGAPSTHLQIDPQAMVEKAQVFYWRNRRYCFYDDAWNGPGWYYCGYAWRRGYGWGGARGWHGWRHYDRGSRRGRDWNRSDRRRFDGDRRGRVERPGRPDRGVRSGPRGGDRATSRGSGRGGSATTGGRGGGSGAGSPGGSSGGPSSSSGSGGRGR